MHRSIYFLLLILSSLGSIYGQTPVISNGRLETIRWADHSTAAIHRPVCAFDANDVYTTSDRLPVYIQLDYQLTDSGMYIQLRNTGNDTLSIKNFLPLGRRSDQVYITGKGEHPLSRAHLFTPGHDPVNIIVPDNLWHMGYASIQTPHQPGLYFFSRRKSWKDAIRRRFEMLVLPGGSVRHQIYIDTFSGAWQNGLRTCFQVHKLYDLTIFDDRLYRRADLHWIRDAKMIHLLMAWDQRFYDSKKKEYRLEKFITGSKSLYGGDDVLGIWPTWPALGLDQRNQWDMYKSLPGGLKALRKLSDKAHQLGSKLFIAYNPWDESTRPEDHLAGMAQLIKAVDADGVILDTRGNSSHALQQAADQVKSGVIMYSEGMAIPADMPWIVSGRVHNALYYPPILNLNKWIQPEFAIFRVTEVYKEPIRREIHSALLNGYGLEFNLFHPGDPMQADDQYRYLGRALRILREHTSAFNSLHATPLYPTDSRYAIVNHWPAAKKEIFTLYTDLAQGIDGIRIPVQLTPGRHYIDLWSHQELKLDSFQGHWFMNSRLDPFPYEYKGTNNEGSVTVLAGFESVLKVDHRPGESIQAQATRGTHILIWPGNPDYTKAPKRLDIRGGSYALYKLFDTPFNKLVIQVFDSLELIDERVIEWPGDRPIKIPAAMTTFPARTSLKDKIKINGGQMKWYTSHGDAFIPYPTNGQGEEVTVSDFWIDPYPVTNEAYRDFLLKTKYKPHAADRFLAHWARGRIAGGDEKKPVVYISKDDAEAYCRWLGGRLPTEIEWQYAAQTDDGNPWPWGVDAGIQKIEKELITETLTHEIYSSFDSSKANPGNGILNPIGTYPSGANKYGLHDLVGSVWQMTSDEYQTGSYRYSILKGGSYFKPLASYWYVQGGPRPLTYRQAWLQVDASFERNATVGCRCVWQPKE
jgi:gamma-glutamyl hercynylcysteine S-oxide synthase